MRKGGTSHYDVVELDPGRALVTETRFPGARFGHERRVERSGSGAEISHRLYVTGPLWVGWALMLSRKRMRQSVELFAEREREIVEPEAPRRPRKRRRREPAAPTARSSSDRARSRSRADRGDDPEAQHDLGLRPGQQLEVVVNRGHQQHPLSEHLEG